MSFVSNRFFETKDTWAPSSPRGRGRQLWEAGNGRHVERDGVRRGPSFLKLWSFLIFCLFFPLLPSESGKPCGGRGPGKNTKRRAKFRGYTPWHSRPTTPLPLPPPPPLPPPFRIPSKSFACTDKSGIPRKDAQRRAGWDGPFSFTSSASVGRALVKKSHENKCVPLSSCPGLARPVRPNDRSTPRN